MARICASSFLARSCQSHGLAAVNNVLTIYFTDKLLRTIRNSLLQHPYYWYNDELIMTPLPFVLFFSYMLLSRVGRMTRSVPPTRLFPLSVPHKYKHTNLGAATFGHSCSEDSLYYHGPLYAPVSLVFKSQQSSPILLHIFSQTASRLSLAKFLSFLLTFPPISHSNPFESPYLLLLILQLYPTLICSYSFTFILYCNVILKI